MGCLKLITFSAVLIRLRISSNRPMAPARQHINLVDQYPADAQSYGLASFQTEMALGKSPLDNYYNYCEHHQHQLPARTAQGGGGSFKDRKPIGEVACCDASMAEQSH